MRYNTLICYALLYAIATPLLPLDSTAQTRSDSKSKTTTEKSEKPAPKTKPTPKPNPKPAPPQSSEADNPIDPQAFNEALLSRLVFDLTNVERRRFKLSEFENNQSLHASATGHSRDMAARNYFEHKSKGIFRGTAPQDRMKAAGYAPSMSAENIAMIPTFNSQRTQSYGGGAPQVIETDYNSYNRLAAYSTQQWMESPGHRKNILNPQLKEMGVGVAIGMKDNVPYVYLTQNFGG